MTMLLFIPPPWRIVMKIIIIRKELSMRGMNESARTVSFEQAYILFSIALFFGTLNGHLASGHGHHMRTI
jgi:hypothetical protein